MFSEPYFGESSKIKSVERCIDVAAADSCSVLLLGETGTGKGMFARLIHNRGFGKNSSFVDVNCSGLKGDLLKSELFGHVKGAFTNAICDRRGLIEEANGGTLFLDEIGDMGIDVQCQLLKAIEEKTYRRLGETEPRKSDFRLICATSRNLFKAMNEGTFLKDLYYRINTLTLHIPSLKSRREDIPGLLDYLLGRMGYGHLPVSGDIVEMLMQRRWRGNIRELRNVLERAMVFAQGEVLALEHFCDVIVGSVSQVSIETGEDPAEQYVEYMAQLKDIWDLEVLEEAHIRRAIKHFKNDKVKTSQALGISLSCLYRKLNKMRNEGSAGDKNEDCDSIAYCA